MNSPDELAEVLWVEYGETSRTWQLLAHGAKTVYRGARHPGLDWIVRAYPNDHVLGAASRVAGVAAILATLERHHYPAERVVRTCQGAMSVQRANVHYLATTFLGPTLQPWQPDRALNATGVEKLPTPASVTPATFAALGAALGRLHRLPVASASFPTANMLPSRESAWVAGELAAVAEHITPAWRQEYEALRTAVEQISRCADAPLALIHNDPNLGNTVITPAGGVAFIDWEMAGIGPAVVDVGILLRNCFSKPARRIDEAAVRAAVDGYCQERMLTPLEQARLPDAIRFMTLVLLAAYFPERMSGAVSEDQLLYGATYADWQAQYAASAAIAALAVEVMGN